MIERAQLAAATLVWLSIMFVPLEWAFPAWRGQPRRRAGAGADLLFFLGQHLVFATAIAALLAWVVAHAPSFAAIDGLHAAFAELPLLARVVVVLMLGDLCAYWAHRAQHAFEPLWRFHAVHHTSTHLDWLAAHREHPLDGLYTQAMVNLPALLLGLRFDQLLGLIVFRSAWAIFIHANVRLPLGPLRMLFGSPELHHHHHARDRHAGNYANLAPYLDWIFGSYERPAASPDALGIDEPHPTGYFALLAHPFRPRASVRQEDAVEAVGNAGR